MTTYEVRERKLVYHYYRVEANSKKEAKLKAQDPANYVSYTHLRAHET